MDEGDRHKVCELIEAVIAADGIVEPAERDYLRRIVERFGLPERPEAVISSDGSAFGRATTTLRGLTPDVQKGVMALLVEAAIVDGRVDPQERALLLASAASLGIDATALEERIVVRLSTIPPP